MRGVRISGLGFGPIGAGGDPALPLTRSRSALFLPWLFAPMVYIAALAGVGLIAVETSMHAAHQRLANAATVEIPADASDARLQTVLALLRQTPGVASVQLIDPQETGRLLQPWLGAGVELDQLPVPRLIDLRLDPDAAADLATLRHQLAAIIPEARLEDHRASLPALDAAGRAGERILTALASLALALIATLAAFAAVGALEASSARIELLHLLGAPERVILRQFMRRSLISALLGGAIGSAAALVSVAALRGAAGLVQLPAPAGIGVADWRLWAVLAGAVAAAALIAVASAHTVVRRHLARLP